MTPRRRTLGSLSLLLPLCLLAPACGSDDEPSVSSGDNPLAIDCTDTIESIYGDPGALPDKKGAILRCAPDGTLTSAQIQARLDAENYQGEPMRSGAKIFRVLYRTERGNGEPGSSAAMVYVPDAPRADKAPTLVVSHGSRGQAPHCAPSLADPRAEQVNDDQERMVLPWVGAGFPVIAPDLAGFANYGASGNPISGYNASADVARSTLDGARAMRELAPDRLSDQVVLTGHSQGGHTAFSSLALAESYAPDVNIAAVATFVPNWLSQRTWGALFLLAGTYPFAKDPTPNAVSIWYHYTLAELYDGPGRAADIVKPDKYEGVKKFVDDTCWGPPYPAMDALGTNLQDVFDPAFTSAVQASAALGAECPADEPAKSTCEKWIARYLSDRPHLTGKAATIPILVNYGGKDDAIPSDRFQCVLDRLHEDKVNLEYCFDPEGMHGELPLQLSGYTINWIANKTLGEALEAPCPSKEINLIDDNGDPMKCNTPPPND
jgi:predicted esterase